MSEWDDGWKLKAGGGTAGGYAPGGTDVALADGGTGASLVDPNADRIMFWDDSAGAVTWLTAGAGLTITGTTIDAAAAAGVADGDKGDITVASGGTVWTIDAGAVTLAKQADMATASVVYRKTAGAGAPEVQTLATLKTDLALTGTNSGDQTSIVGITGTKAQFDTAVTDGNFLYVGDVTSNATHTGDATGDTALTVVKIQGKDFPTLSGADDQKYPKYVSASNAFVMTTVSGGSGIANVVEDLTPQLGGALDPNTFGVSSAWFPNADDGAALGSTAKKWSDLFMASGAVVNYDAGNATITHSANRFDYAGASHVFAYTVAGSAPLRASNTADAASVVAMRLDGDRTTITANDEAYIDLRLSNSGGTQTSFGYLIWKATTVTAASEAGQFEIDLAVAGAMTNVLTLNGTGLSIGTTRALTAGTIELGAASDTTLSRSAAGIVAVEGVPILKATSGVGVTPTASGTTAITHGLGRTPVIVRIWGKSGFTSNAAATPTTSSEGLFTSSGNTCIYQAENGTTTIVAATSTAFAVHLSTSVGNIITGVIQNVGATTFDIVWTETGTHTRGVYMWEAQ
jgi:hypothetical protein